MGEIWQQAPDRCPLGLHALRTKTRLLKSEVAACGMQVPAWELGVGVATPAQWRLCGGACRALARVTREPKPALHAPVAHCIAPIL